MSRRTETDHEGLLGEVVQATERAEAAVVADAPARWTPIAFRLANVLSAVLITMFGIAICVASRSYALWVGDRPGPGFFPGIIGVGLTALGVVYLIGAIGRRYRLHDDSEPPPDRSAMVRSALSVAVVGAAAFALVPIGYPIVSASSVAVLLRLAGGRWRAAVVTGVLFAAISFVLVTTVLGIQLPTGLLRPLLIGLL